MQLTLKPWGNSQGIMISKSILKELGINKKEAVFNYKVKNGKLILEKDQKLKPQFKSMEEFIGNFDYNKYWDDWEQEHPGESKEYDWGAPVGKEII